MNISTAILKMHWQTIRKMKFKKAKIEAHYITSWSYIKLFLRILGYFRVIPNSSYRFEFYGLEKSTKQNASSFIHHLQTLRRRMGSMGFDTVCLFQLTASGPATERGRPAAWAAAAASRPGPGPSSPRPPMGEGPASGTRAREESATANPAHVSQSSKHSFFNLNYEHWKFLFAKSFLKISFMCCSETSL